MARRSRRIVLVYEDAANPQRFHTSQTTEDERFAILTISERGKGKDGNALHVRDLSKGRATFAPAHRDDRDDTFSVVDNVGDKLLVADEPQRAQLASRADRSRAARRRRTGRRAARAARADPGRRPAGGKLFVTYSKDVRRARTCDSVDGTLENEVTLPGPGTAAGFGGRTTTRSCSTRSTR